MKDNFKRSLDLVLQSEGGFVNHPKDPGGATNLGVTMKTWAEWVMPKLVTADDMKALTPELVAPLYKNRYWDACKCDNLPAGLDYLVFDVAVNSGTRRSAKFLQDTVGVNADGYVGPATLNAVNSGSFSTEYLINKICDKREAFWKSLSTFNVFGKGWIDRGNHVRYEALKML